MENSENWSDLGFLEETTDPQKFEKFLCTKSKNIKNYSVQTQNNEQTLVLKKTRCDYNKKPENMVGSPK